jgi:hypothetical protein
MGKNRPKNPKSSFHPVGEKKPKADLRDHGRKEVRGLSRMADLVSERKTPVWKLSHIDKDGPFGEEFEPGLLDGVVNTLQGIESMDWASLGQQGSHFVKVEGLAKEARKRLEHLHLDDVDGLYSIRISGKKRIWAIKISNSLAILWWDPKHAVCPSHLRNT